MKKNYRICLLWILAGCALSVNGQEIIVMPDASAEDASRPYRQKHEEKVDDTRLECLYEFVGKDTVINIRRWAQYFLQVGTVWTKCSDYSSYWTDSVCWRTDWKITGAEMRELDMPRNSIFQESQLRNMADDRFTCLGQAAFDRYVYEDSTARMDWTLTADTATVCGYPCRKATTRFRGRNWTAWYTEKLPVDAGPWKLHGLPGLILRAEEGSGLLRFEAVQLRTPKADTYYVARTLPESQDVPMKREETLELVRKVATHYGTYLRAKAAEMPSSGQGGVRTAYFERIFYQPLELE